MTPADAVRSVADFRASTATRSRELILGSAQDLTPFTIGICGVSSAVLLGAAISAHPAAGLGVVLATAIALSVLRYPALGGYILVALVPIASGLRRGAPVPNFRFSEVLVVAIAVLVIAPAMRRNTVRWGIVDWAGFIFASLAVLLPVMHLLERGERVEFATIASTLLPLQFFILYRTVRTAIQSRIQRDFAVRLLLLASLLVSFLAVVQQLDIGPARSIIYSLTASDALDSYGYSVYARATGPFQHWHPLAGYLVVILLLTSALLLDRGQRVLSRNWLLVILAAGASALMLSVTFVSILGTLVGALILGARANKLRQAFVWLSAGGVAAMALFGSFVVTRIRNQYDDGVGGRRESLVPQTVQYRIDVWRDQYLPGMGGHWFAGYGPDLPPDAAWSHTESVYITLALRGGIPLLAAFVAPMIAIAWTAKRLEADPTRQPLARALIALVAVLWFMHLLFPYFTSSGMPQPFWVLVGIALAGWQMNRSHGATEQNNVEAPHSGTTGKALST